MFNPLARFSFESNRLSKEKRQPKPKLFQPTRHMCLSVARVENLSCEKIQEVGIAFGRKRNDDVRHLYGWAKFSREELSRIGLVIEDDEAPCLHSEIRGWEEDKAKRDRQIQGLIQVSQVVLLETPILFINC